MPEASEVPPGFRPHGRHSPVTAPWEPLFARVVDSAYRIGFHVRECHCNGRGFLHGGVVAAIADNAMGLTYGLALEGMPPRADGRPVRGSIVTLGLSVDYVATAAGGSWFEVQPRLLNAGKATGFVDALLLADGAVVARANATFRNLVRD